MGEFFKGFPDIEGTKKFREDQNNKKFDKIETVEYDYQFHKLNGFGNKLKAFIILDNLMYKKNYSIIDKKFILTEHYFRYNNMKDEEKLHSNGQNKYLNSAGISITNKSGFQQIYIKNNFKYFCLQAQSMFIKKMFLHPDTQKLDLKCVQMVIEKIKELMTILKNNNLFFFSSSILVLVNVPEQDIKVRFIDFSYFPSNISKFDYCGSELFVELLENLK
jgi:hypothetical protein